MTKYQLIDNMRVKGRDYSVVSLLQLPLFVPIHLASLPLTTILLTPKISPKFLLLLIL